MAKNRYEYLKIRSKETPEKTSIIFYGREISYREIDETPDRFANYLQRQGVEKGERVAIFMANCLPLWKFFLPLLGTQKILQRVLKEESTR